jgi:NADP-dependent 3-hydroxy acid dehydrogenase YdfG
MASPTHPVFRKGANALITGAASGIGLAMTRFCNSLDMNVILMDQNLDALNEARKSLDPYKHPSRATSHLIDVSSIDLRMADIGTKNPSHIP